MSRLRPPGHNPGGPDGNGWNRLSLNAHMDTLSDQCAFQPRSYVALHESRRSALHARWGNSYGRCTWDGTCHTCPIAEAREEPTWLPADTPRVLVRLKESSVDGGWLGRPAPTPYVVDDPDAGWSSPRYRWTWERLARLRGWKVDRRHVDEHSEGFWLVKEDPTLLHGTEREETRDEH